MVLILNEVGLFRIRPREPRSSCSSKNITACGGVVRSVVWRLSFTPEGSNLQPFASQATHRIEIGLLRGEVERLGQQQAALFWLCDRVGPEALAAGRGLRAVTAALFISGGGTGGGALAARDQTGPELPPVLRSDRSLLGTARSSAKPVSIPSPCRHR